MVFKLWNRHRWIQTHFLLGLSICTWETCSYNKFYIVLYYLYEYVIGIFENNFAQKIMKIQHKNRNAALRFMCYFLKIWKILKCRFFRFLGTFVTRHRSELGETVKRICSITCQNLTHLSFEKFLSVSTRFPVFKLTSNLLEI